MIYVVEYVNVLNDINVGIIFFNNENILKTTNPLSKLLGVEKEDLNLDVYEIFNNNQEFLDFYNCHDLSKQIFLFNDKYIEVKKKDMMENGDKLGQIFTLTNVSSRVRELEQKDMLVKELTHRVKNNLQIILSSLNLDLHYHPNDSERVIADTCFRLNYMFTLHDKIYRSNGSTNKNIKEYLLILLIVYLICMKVI
ncbi:MAG: hypothetical protein K1X33_02770 [Methanobacteriaceae archaeon]|nr:hypothetical protein [Methanobacteriaceae archaeon]